MTAPQPPTTVLREAARRLVDTMPVWRLGYPFRPTRAQSDAMWHAVGHLADALRNAEAVEGSEWPAEDRDIRAAEHYLGHGRPNVAGGRVRTAEDDSLSAVAIEQRRAEATCAKCGKHAGTMRVWMRGSDGVYRCWECAEAVGGSELPAGHGPTKPHHCDNRGEPLRCPDGEKCACRCVSCSDVRCAICPPPAEPTR